ncbi:MAG: TVP38/TMEM64 family protein [Spirochaetaceae bacterium]
MRQSSSPRRSPEALVFPLIILGILVGALVFREELTAVFRNPEAVERWIADLGAQARLVFLLVQVFQVVVFVVPGEVVQIAGGYLFGIGEGALWSTAGIAVGATVNYWIGRWSGRAFIERFLSEKATARFTSIATSPRGRLGFFLLFVIPGIPKDVLCYVAGGASMGFWGFLVISTVGRLPGIVGSAVIGGTAAAERWMVSAGVLALAVVLFLAGVAFRRRLEAFVEGVTRRRRSE